MVLRFVLAAALVASPAFGAEPPEAPVATASAPSGVAEQIDAYLRSSPVLEVEDLADVDGVVPARPDRRPHGEVGVAVGTGGFRSVYGRADMPLGDTARVSLAFQDTRYGRAYGRPYDAANGGGFGLRGLDRQRCDLEAMTPLRSLDAMGGPHGRCMRAMPDW